MELQRNASIILRDAQTLLTQAAEYDNGDQRQAKADILATLARVRGQLDQIRTVVDDTAPLVKSRRVCKLVRIQEVNTPPSSLFDTTVEYPSDSLPQWFAPLQSIVEDDTFTSASINLGGKVEYRIAIVSVGLPVEPPNMAQE
jgi:hypothetical protein